MRYIQLFIFALASLHVCGQSTARLGDPAPEVDFQKILNSETTTGKLSDFKSRVVILDFWATWCGPCIEAFPHLEALQKKFGNDLKILTVTDDPEERISKFLAKRNVALPIVMDTDRVLAAQFPHRLIPHTVVIDKNGIIRAITTPEKLTDEVIQRIIRNQQVSLVEKKDVMDFDPSKPISGNGNFTYQITVTPYQEGLPAVSNPTGGEGAYKNRRILCMNLSLQSLYEIAFQFPAVTRTVIESKNTAAFAWSKQTAVCFDLIVPEALGTQRFEMMKQHLSLLYPFKPIIEKRQTKIKILKVIDGHRPNIKPSAGGQTEVAYSGGGLSMKNAALNTVAAFLESQFNMPVVDETKTTGLFDLELIWYKENPDLIHDELKKIGLTLVDAVRDIDVLVIQDK